MLDKGAAKSGARIRRNQAGMPSGPVEVGRKVAQGCYAAFARVGFEPTTC